MTTATDLSSQIALRLATAQTEEIDQAIQDVLSMLGQHTRSDRTYLTQFYRDGTIEVRHEWLDPNIPPHGVAVGVAEAETFAFSIDLARQRKRLDIADISEMSVEAEAERKSFAAFNVVAILQVPIITDDEVIGVLGFNCQARRDWSDVDAGLIDVATQALGVTVFRQWALQDRAAAAVEAERARHAASHLIGRFSHELRTPLHVILGYTELLQLNATAPEDTDALTQIQFNGRRLLALVDDLMRLDHDSDHVDSLVSLSETLADVVDAISPAVRHRQIDVEVDIDETIELWFDRGRLRQVLYCQLAATVQNMPPGTSVKYSAHRQDGAAEVVLAVTGHGDEPLAAVSMPLADALLEGVAELTIVSDAPTQWTAHFTLPTSPPPAPHIPGHS